jgi:hypothetical protein
MCEKSKTYNSIRNARNLKPLRIYGRAEDRNNALSSQYDKSKNSLQNPPKG